MGSSSLTSYAAPLSRGARQQSVLIAMVVAVCVLAAVYMPALLAVAGVLAVVIFFLERPFQLLLLMVFLIPFNFVFTVGPVPVAAELLKLFAWVPFLIYQRQNDGRFTHSRHGKWFLVLAAIILLSLFRARDLPYTVKESVRLASNIGLVYLAVNLVDTQEKLMQLFRVLTVSTFLVACYGFYQWYIQDFGALFWIVNPRLNTSLAHYRDEFWQWRNRMISVLTSEMELGHYFNLCLPIAALLWITQGKRRVSSKWLWMTLAMLAGLLLTFTFGAWLALAGSMGLFVLLLDKKRRWKFVGGLLVVVLVCALVVTGPLLPLVQAKFSGRQIGSFEWDVFT